MPPRRVHAALALPFLLELVRAHADHLLGTRSESPIAACSVALTVLWGRLPAQMWMLPLPAFYNPELASVPGVIVVDYLVDVCFIIDLVFTFFIRSGRLGALCLHPLAVGAAAPTHDVRSARSYFDEWGNLVVDQKARCAPRCFVVFVAAVSFSRRAPMLAGHSLGVRDQRLLLDGRAIQCAHRAAWFVLRDCFLPVRFVPFRSFHDSLCVVGPAFGLTRGTRTLALIR